MHPDSPIRFGKYLLLDRIALGGMAELYRARIMGAGGFEKLVVIKKILPHLTSEEALVNAFIDEAKLAALLQHQNIVQIYDFGNMEGAYFIAMEHLFGKDLRLITNKSNEKGLSLSREYALHITSRICEGLDYAHKLKDFEGNPLNIIHRDISPPNIFITYDGEVKILDFGIAKAAIQNTKTSEGVIKGKVSYMSPEQAAGEPIDQRSDVYSTGILLYEMLTGSQMYVGDALQILTQVRKGSFRPPEIIINDLPPRLYEILHRALDKAPEQRYQSNGEMLSDLEECMYQNSLRPTTRGLAKYMKGLFEEEIAAEEQVVRKAAQIGVTDKSGGDIKATKGQRTEAISMPTEQITKTWKRVRPWYGAFALAVLVVMGAIFALPFKEASISTPDNMVQVAPVNAPVSGPSKGAQDVETPPPESAKNAPHDASHEDQDVVAYSTPAPPPEQQEMASHGQMESDTLEAGIAALKKGHFAEAADLFDQVPVLEPHMAEKISGLYAQALLGQAATLAEEDPQMAESLLLKAVRLDPESVQAYLDLGLVYLRQEDYPKAIETYEKATELEPQTAKSFFNLGYIYQVTRNYSKAEEMYGQVVELAPSYLDEALFNLAMVQEKQGKRDQCIENLERALRLNPDNRLAGKYLLKLKADPGEKP